ncbi:hypothetical protein CVT25_001992 [Psilocybe cyanescens]|uniref:Uncharacterized protein n=1 Tax=Psilocybe cyanescens TaxID=93625 RepID=A0A409VUM3_PSICY|nr:hypothetical protein CVT25_001992 [Psilocybe cyanescens]
MPPSKRQVLVKLAPGDAVGCEDNVVNLSVLVMLVSGSAVMAIPGGGPGAQCASDSDCTK